VSPKSGFSLAIRNIVLVVLDVDVFDLVVNVIASARDDCRGGGRVVRRVRVGVDGRIDAEDLADVDVGAIRVDLSRPGNEKKRKEKNKEREEKEKRKKKTEENRRRRKKDKNKTEEKRKHSCSVSSSPTTPRHPPADSPADYSQTTSSRPTHTSPQ
jgi:hypothetical protein